MSGTEGASWGGARAARPTPELVCAVNAAGGSLMNESPRARCRHRRLP